MAWLWIFAFTSVKMKAFAVFTVLTYTRKTLDCKVASATGSGHWPRPLTPATGSGRWLRPLAPAAGSGHWLRPQAPATGSGHWLRPLAPATGSGHWLRPLAPATGSGHWLLSWLLKMPGISGLRSITPRRLYPGNTSWRGRLGTVYLLIKIAYFVTKVTNIFDIKMSWS